MATADHLQVEDQDTAGDRVRGVGGAHPRLDQVGDPGPQRGAGGFVCAQSPRPCCQRCWELGTLACKHVDACNVIKCGPETPAGRLHSQVQFNGVYYEPPEVAPAGQLQEGARYTFKYPRPER